MKVSHNVVIVEDNKFQAKAYESILKKYGFNVTDTYKTGELVLAKLKKKNTDLLILDINLPGELDGVDLGNKVSAENNIPFIFITAKVSEHAVKKVAASKDAPCLVKPFEANELLSAIEVAFYRNKMKKHVDEMEKSYVSAFNILGEGVIMTDYKGEIQYLNPIAQVLTGWKQSEAVGEMLTDILHMSNDSVNKKSIKNRVKIAFEDIEKNLKANLVLTKKDKTIVPIEVASIPIKNIHGYIKGMVYIFSSRTHHSSKNREVLATVTDELTGLYNRVGFVTIAEVVLKMAQREGRTALFTFIDIDNMKEINSAFGDLMGNKTLLQVTELLKDTLRTVDIIARTGGDDFASITFISDKNDKKIIMDRFQKNQELINASKDRIFDINLSVGFSMFDPKHPKELSELINEAIYGVREDKKNINKRLGVE